MSTKNKEFPTCSSSAGVKSFLMLKVFLISSGVLPAQFKFHSLSKLGKQKLTLDHVGNSLAGHIQETLKIKTWIFGNIYLLRLKIKVVRYKVIWKRRGGYNWRSCDTEYLDIEVVGCQDQLKESSLVHLKKENTHKHATHLDLDSVQPSESQHPRWRCHPSSFLCSRHPQVEVGRPATYLKSS